MKELTLREKIGQMIITGFYEDEITEELKALIYTYKIGNIILFSYNIKSAAQLKALCGELQKTIQTSTGYPAFIAVDQEGGTVTRLPEDAVNIPGAMAIAATGDEQNAYAAGKLTAQELRALGVNLDFAPVLDINSNRDNPVIGVRSYGDSKETVSRFGVQMMNGLLAGGVLAAVKHFPGHGDTAVDSHLGLPVVEKTAERLRANELAPFAAAIRAGAPCVMTSHILFPKIEKEKLPATMSRAILTDLLRGELNFQGLIISDCLEMDAIKKYYGTARGALAAVKAGVNLLCISHTSNLVIETVNTLEEAVNSGELPIAVIDASVEKILKYKAEYALCKPEDVPAPAPVGCMEHRRAAQKMRAQSITLAAGKKLPVIDGDSLFLGCCAYRATRASGNVDRDLSFPAYMAQQFNCAYRVTPADPGRQEIDAVIKSAEPYQTVVVGTYNGHLNKGQIDLVNGLCAAKHRVVAVALRNPYDLGLIDGAAAKIAAYEYSRPVFDLLADILKGKRVPEGRLPVAL